MGKVGSPVVFVAKKLLSLDPKNRPGTEEKLTTWLGRLPCRSRVVSPSIPHTAAVLRQAFKSGKDTAGEPVLPTEALAKVPLDQRLGAKDAEVLEKLASVAGSDKGEQVRSRQVGDPQVKRLATKILKKWCTAQLNEKPVEVGRLLVATHLVETTDASTLLKDCLTQGLFSKEADGSIKYGGQELLEKVAKSEDEGGETSSTGAEKEKSEGHFSVEVSKKLAQGSVVLEMLKKQEIKKTVREICPYLKLERVQAEFGPTCFSLETALQPPDPLLVEHIKGKVQDSIESWLPPPLDFDLQSEKVDGKDVMRIQEITKCRLSHEGASVRVLQPTKPKVSDEILVKMMEAHLQPTAWRDIGQVKGKQNIGPLIGKQGRALQVFERKNSVQIRFKRTSPDDAADEEVAVAVWMKLRPSPHMPGPLQKDPDFKELGSTWLKERYEVDAWWKGAINEWSAWSTGMQDPTQRKKLLR